MNICNSDCQGKDTSKVGKRRWNKQHKAVIYGSRCKDTYRSRAGKVPWFSSVGPVREDEDY